MAWASTNHAIMPLRSRYYIVYLKPFQFNEERLYRLTYHPMGSSLKRAFLAKRNELENRIVF